MMEWFWDTMVSMTLLMAFVLMIRKPVAHFFGAKISYLLWVLPLARLFMPVLTLEAPAPVEIAESTAASSPIAAMTPDVIAVEQIAATGALAAVDWMLIAMIIWAGGAGMLFISKLASYIQFREDIISDGQLVGHHGSIRILETAAVGGPLAFGLFRKYIAVPTDFFRNYAPRERELALEHEIAHHESGDLAANFVGLFILSLHWFNPVAWFSWMAFRQDQETACDARILQKTGHEARAVYGRTIAKSAAKSAFGQQLGLASPLGQKDKIKGRLKMLGQREKSSFRKKLGGLLVGTSTVIALPLTATVTYAETAVAHPEDDDGIQIHSAGTSVDVSDKDVLVTKKTDDGYKYTVSNKRGTFELDSERKLKRSEIDTKLSRMVPSYEKLSAPKTPAAPAWPEPVSKSKEGETINITMLNGSKDFANDEQYVHRIRHDGRTIVLRTNKKLTNAEVKRMIEEAEESRAEAHSEMKEHEREAKQHEREARQEMREAEREARAMEREWQREMRETQREVARSVREAKHEMKKAEREAREAIREAQIISTQTVYNARNGRYEMNANRHSNVNRSRGANSAIPTPLKPPVSPVVNVRGGFITTSLINGFSSAGISKSRKAKCKNLGEGVRYDARRGVMTEQTWAKLVGCLNVPVAGNKKKYLKLTLETLKSARMDVANSCDKSDAKHKRKIQVYDREIQHLERKLTSV